MPQEPQDINRKAAEQQGARLPELAGLFLRLGFTAFGGPAAHIAMMREEIVGRKAWLTEREFIDLIGAANLIPGPNSTELAIHIGYKRAGWAGLLASGICFILPAALIMTALACLYARYGSAPHSAALLYGAKPVVIAIIVQALYAFMRGMLNRPAHAILFGAVTLFALVQANALILLPGAGAALGAWHCLTQKPKISSKPLIIFAILSTFLILAPRLAHPSAFAGFSLHALFLYFLKIGSVLYGSGYVLLAFLRTDLVQHWHWLSETQLLDATAIGQITPGPLFTTATFIGYLLGGLPGALLATIGVFLPAFVFVAASSPLIPSIRRSRAAGKFLDGVNLASLALMLAVTLDLARAAIVDFTTGGIVLTAAFLLFRHRINSVWLILAGALAGWLMHSIAH